MGNSKSQETFEFIMYAVIGIILACSIGIASFASKDEVTFTVDKTERIQEGEDSFYLVFTDKGVFKNVDTYWQWKFNSSDLQGKLVVGKTVTCSKNFWRLRIPLFSQYENLLSCK